MMYRFLKQAAVFLLGSYAIVAQVTFLREFLVIFLGNELCLGIIFSSWFLGVALGAAASARPARAATAGERQFVLVGSLLAGLSPPILFLIRIVRTILTVPPGEYIPFLSLVLSTWALVIPFSFFIGFVFPFACLMALGREERGIRNVGVAYVLEAVGSIAGGVLFSFVLVGRVPALHILCGWSAALLLLLFLISGERPGGTRARPAIAALCALWCFLIVSGAADHLEALSIRLRWRSISSALPLVASVDSRYENIAIGKREAQYDLFGNGQYYLSFPDPYVRAAAAHMIMSEHPRPERVLLIGGGAGGMMGELLRYPLSRLQYVELDPALIRIMEPRLESPERAALRDPRVRVSYGDGRRFVKEVRERFDMVIVNTPDPSTAMLNRFYTRQFYEEVRAILAPGGVLATRLSAPADYYGEDVGSYAASVYRTLRSVFPYLVVAPGEENYFFASPAPDIVTSDIDTLRERWLHRGIPTERFTPHHFLIWWLPERVAFTQNALEARSNAPLNTDFKPVTYYFNLILWARFSGSRIAGFLRVLERVGLRWYLLPIACVLLARLVYLFAGGRRGERQNAVHALLAVGAMGFTAMALEIILIFAFQNIYGYVYQMMGVIVALFMAGLACGGFASNGLLKRPGRPWTAWLSGVAFLLAAYAAIVPWVLHRAAGAGVHSEYVFMALVFLTGAVTGMEFPLASRIYLRDASGVGRAAARVNGFDHFGACAGSLLTGVVFVPLIGIVATCIFLAALNSACGALLLTCRAAE